MTVAKADGWYWERVREVLVVRVGDGQALAAPLLGIRPLRKLKEEYSYGHFPPRRSGGSFLLLSFLFFHPARFGLFSIESGPSFPLSLSLSLSLDGVDSPGAYLLENLENPTLPYAVIEGIRIPVREKCLLEPRKPS